MEEYEYSFKVKDIKPYIDYCIKEGYEEREKSYQNRILYKSNSNVMARITIKEIKGNKKIILDFKDNSESEEVLKISRETIPLELNENNLSAIYSILEILDYKETKNMIRNRIIYFKDNVTFEIDNYLCPEVMNVVGIEGEKDMVDTVYLDLKDKINNLIKV